MSAEFGKVAAYLAERGATDIHFTDGFPLLVRFDGDDLSKIDDRIFSRDDVTGFILRFFPHNPMMLESASNLAFEAMGKRIRVKTSKTLGVFQVFLRLLPLIPSPMEDLGYDDDKCIDRILGIRPPSGIFIVNGAAGSGKSTFTAAFLRQCLERFPLHLVTIEDPVEYVYSRVPSILGEVSHREIPCDVPSFAEGVRDALREDPDIINVGEVRDQETAEAVMAASETGHFVICTVHASNHEGALNRLLGLLPSKDAARRLASVHLGGASMKRVREHGRVFRSVDITLTSLGVRACIIEDKLHQLDSNWDMARRNAEFGPWSAAG